MILSVQDFAALGGLIIAIISPVLAYLIKIRHNDLKHLNDALERIENKLDDHMRDHAQGLFQ